MNVYLINSGNDGCCYVRILLPTYANGFLTDQNPNKMGRDIKKIMADIAQANVVVFHRPENQEFLNLIELLKAEGKKVVVDNDDTFKIADKHPLAQWTSHAHKVELEKRDSYFDQCARKADLLTTTTEALAEEYRKINDNVLRLPNCVDPLDWDEPLRTKGKKVRIGMVGSVTYAYDYAHIKPVLKDLSGRDDVQLVMFGFGNASHKKKNPEVTEYFQSEYDFWESLDVEHIPWCPIEDYPTKLNEARLDMMLIPRRDNYFNRCKSNIKFLEASMCEIPVIAQSFNGSPYEELTSDIGLLVGDNEDWSHTTDILIDNKKLRRRIGKQAKEYVLDNYSIDVRGHEWHDAYKKLYGN